jgi:hypothetical protein
VIVFAKAVLRRFLIGCAAAVVAAVVLSGLHQAVFTMPPAPIAPPTPTASTAAGCDDLIASGATGVCRIVDQDDVRPGGPR